MFASTKEKYSVFRIDSVLRELAHCSERHGVGVQPSLHPRGEDVAGRVDGRCNCGTPDYIAYSVYMKLVIRKPGRCIGIQVPIYHEPTRFRVQCRVRLRHLGIDSAYG